MTDAAGTERMQALLRQYTHRDALTGLPNHLAFTEFVEHRLAADSGLPRPRRFALLYIDLDDLRHINDTWGHEQGDQVIAQFATHLQRTLPRPHFLCRRSGDEFIAVLDIDEDGDRLRARLAAALPSMVHEVRLGEDSRAHVSMSMGAAVYPQHAGNLRDLLVLADTALLFAKEAGRARVTWLDADIAARIQRRRALHLRLLEAVHERRIVPHYQPEIDMRDGRITGFEALARWHDPELGDVPPAEFIAVAEEKGLIDRVTEVLLEKLLADLPAIRARFADARVAFNAPPQLLADHRLAALLAARLGEAASRPCGLVLELTESELAQGTEGATAQLAAIIDMGVQIAIDDFGKAYSSLSRLSRLPVHKLKIDGSFVQALDQEGNAKVVAAIMALAGALALDVTAEGVEQPFQRERLLGMGCHKAQGFLFARPMPLAQVLTLPARLPLPPGA